MAKLGSALTIDRYEAQRMIKEAVANASNLAEAMECVGAMYGIPPSHIMVDDNLKSVKVVNDNIVCPSNVSATNNTDAIVKSISTLLDQISERIDSKINGVQRVNIDAGRFNDSVLNASDPSKGKVVATYKDANGDPVIVYDSGIIDAADSPEGRAKARELRESGTVADPTARDPFAKKDVSYFSDEDNVMNGISPTQYEDDAPNTPSTSTTEAYSIADMIGESAYFIDAMAKLGDTSELGKAIFTTHGYDCVTSVGSSVVQEAALRRKNKKKSIIRPEDIKYMKFDTTDIHKCIKYFNEARAEQPKDISANEINIEQLSRSPKTKEAIKCLEKQFDCHISMRWGGADEEDGHMAGTFGFDNEYLPNLTCSKSKGFQFGGKEIWIVNLGQGITGLIPDDPSLFGQAVTGILLHEIFHNIAAMMRTENGVFVTTLTVTISDATRAKTPEARRNIIERYVESINRSAGGKLGKIGKRLMVKQLLALVASNGDKNKIDAVLKAAKNRTDVEAAESGYDAEAEFHVRGLASAYNKFAKKVKRHIGGMTALSVINIVLGAIVVVLSTILLIIGNIGGPLFVLSYTIAGGAIGSGIGTLVDINRYKKIVQQFKDSRNMEEYYCDLMAAMYKLPVSMFAGGGYGIDKKYPFNSISEHTMNDFIIAERAAYEACMSVYPTPSERTWTAITSAKKLLECKHLDKNVRSYLEWLVANNDQILKSDIKTNYSKSSFDPEEAEDLDKHMTSMLTNNNVKVVEAAMDYFTDDHEFSEWVANGMQYDAEDSFIIEYYNNQREFDYFYEVATRTDVIGYKDETVGKRLLMFIPRLLLKLLEMINKFLQWLGQEIMVGLMKMVTPDKMYVIGFNIAAASELTSHMSELAKLLYESTRDATTLKEFSDSIETKFPTGGFAETGFDTKKAGIENKIQNLKTATNRVISGRDIVEHTKKIVKDHRYMKPYVERIRDKYDRLMKTDKTDFNRDDAGLKFIIWFCNTSNEVIKTVMQGLNDFRKQRVKPAQTPAAAK